MKPAMGMCFNWKVLAALAAVGVGVLVFAPGAELAVLPLLLLAAWPVLMVVIMLAMKGTDSKGREAASLEALRTHLGRLREEEVRLERDLEARTVRSDEVPGTSLFARRLIASR